MPHGTVWETAPDAAASPNEAPTTTAAADFASPSSVADLDHRHDAALFDHNLESSSSLSSAADNSDNIHHAGRCPCVAPDTSSLGRYRRRQSQLSSLGKAVMASRTADATLSSPSDPARPAGIVTPTLPPDPSRASDVDRLRLTLTNTLAGEEHDAIDKLPSPVSPIDVLHRAGSNGSTFTPRPASSPALRAIRSISGSGAASIPGPGTSSLTAALHGTLPEVTGVSMALNDTPIPTAPSSPRLNGNVPPGVGLVVRTASGASTPRVHPTTLDIPGLTRSKVSPDGRIAPRDVGSKLVIVMVGLPARGKSYITKKLARYLNWLQHDTRIFNVGERRRVAAGGPLSHETQRTHGVSGRAASKPVDILHPVNLPGSAMPAGPAAPLAQVMLNGEAVSIPATPADGAPADSRVNEDGGQAYEKDAAEDLHRPDMGEPISPLMTRERGGPSHAMEHNASFFDPDNHKASQIREQLSRETLDELLDYILDGNGSVGILDATNSTIERRKMVMDRIRERAGPDLNVLFLESRCVDHDLLEANMRLKLSGPDYRGMDPNVALEDFKKRVRAYEKAYVPLGEYEERNGMPYIQMIDVGRKIISHQIKGFLMAQANYYLLNFNLAPRQIWITRHGLSMDNISGRIGGDSDLAPEGHAFARSLTRFMDQKRIEWDEKQLYALENSHFPPQPGDATPPNPHYSPQMQVPSNPSHHHSTSTSTSGSASPISPSESSAAQLVYQPKAYCVWTSMLKRSIQTAQYFNDEHYDTKQMRMLDELNAGVMEGLTYSCISSQFPSEYASRKADKLHYRYPGPGGEGYLDIINRLRPVIVELERMTDHVLLVGHRSVSRVLLAYFRGLPREHVADLDVPLGVLYCLEPKPYGVDFKVYRWHKADEWFYEVPDFKLRRAEDDMV